jgi:hypothetical protein
MRTILHGPIVITVLPIGAGVEMVMLLRDDMAGLYARAYRRTWALWLSFAGDGITSGSVKTRGLKIVCDSPSLFKVYIHASRREHLVKFVIINIV